MLEVSSSQSQSFSHNIKELLTVVIMGLDLICSQFLSTLFCYEKQLSLVLLLYCTSFWRGWNILLYLSGICCITISGTATGISSCISCTCLECVEHQTLVLGCKAISCTCQNIRTSEHQTLVLGCKAISCTCQNIRTSEHQTLVLGCKTISPEEQQQQQQLQPQLQL